VPHGLRRLDGLLCLLRDAAPPFTLLSSISPVSRGQCPELNSVCTPWLCRNLYLASVFNHNTASTALGTFKLGPFDQICSHTSCSSCTNAQVHELRCSDVEGGVGQRPRAAMPPPSAPTLPRGTWPLGPGALHCALLWGTPGAGGSGCVFARGLPRNRIPSATDPRHFRLRPRPEVRRCRDTLASLGPHSPFDPRRLQCGAMCSGGRRGCCSCCSRCRWHCPARHIISHLFSQCSCCFFFEWTASEVVMVSCQVSHRHHRRFSPRLRVYDPLQHHTMVYGMQPARQAPSEQAPHGQATTEQTGWKEPAEPRALPARKACNPPEEAPVGQRALKPKACAPNYALSLFLYTVLYYTTPAVSFGSGGDSLSWCLGAPSKRSSGPRGKHMPLQARAPTVVPSVPIASLREYWPQSLVRGGGRSEHSSSANPRLMQLVPRPKAWPMHTPFAG
jgi:hypothetical protein